MKTLFPVILLSALWSCRQKEPADLLIHHARIYTVDSQFTISEAMAIKDGRILAVGTSRDLMNRYDPKDNLDAAGKAVYPGFIDAHAHFVEYGLGLQTASLVGTESWQAILDTLLQFAAKHPEGWLIGQGWDQNDWPVQEFPDNHRLNELFPDRPVLLSRVDGHAAIANQKALDLAGIRVGDKLEGGEIETRNRQLTGILIDNAVARVASAMPPVSVATFNKALQEAQANCFAMGLTTVDDCGLNYRQVALIDSLQKSGALKMRIYALLSDAKENYDYLMNKGIITTSRLTVRGFKVYADGALGSRGACLLSPYNDKPGHYGFLLSSPAHYDSVAALLANTDFQMCTHAIGDSGNRTILKVYEKYLKGKNDRRWRIEHAQVVNSADFALFGANSIIPSVQPTHATSDMYWAGTRLGKDREKGAYAYKELLEQNHWIPLGTDFPVEDISPFKTFYAAVARKDAKGFPEGGYQVQNALTREETLRGMTIWAAKANFEETQKGSLEPGKFADFIILDKDLMTIPEAEILSVRPTHTFLNGAVVYHR